MHPLFHRYFSVCPLVAIIRGVTQDQAEAVGEALHEGGIRIIEVPLNSPEPLKSIERLAKSMGERALVGAGTVLTAGQVADVQAAGGRLIVSPNTNVEVIAAAAGAGLVSSPGFFTPSEAFAAIGAGAHALKLFPAEGATPAVDKAMKAVLPKDIPLLVVGGVTPATIPAWLAGGADGFGLGSGLFKPGDTPAQVLDHARAYVAALPA
jgi:2-dehydro-3-deoxyphosphogalactonate aldolase